MNAIAGPNANTGTRSHRERSVIEAYPTVLEHVLEMHAETCSSTRRRWPEGVFAGVSQTTVYDTC